ncbi:MAG TPA: hypothetical protein VMW00_06305 [Dehalococcoidales bacterium]|nr:hypothetical protein [Dehalococcoidales bacterium]
MPGDTLKDYEDHKKNVVNLIERAGDMFGGVDERIDWAIPRILNTLEDVRTIKAALAAIEWPDGGTIMPVQKEQIPFAATLAIGQTLRMTEEMHIGGTIKQVSIHWPGGCQNLVDVAVGHYLIRFCPREGYLALDDVTPTYLFNEPVENNEGIWVEMRNRDGFFAHTISVTVTVEGLR